MSEDMESRDHAPAAGSALDAEAARLAQVLDVSPAAARKALQQLIARGLVAITDPDAPIRYGCHVDLFEGDEPDGCVIDEHRHQDCIYARLQGGIPREDKRSCEYWRAISPSSAEPTERA